MNNFNNEEIPAIGDLTRKASALMSKIDGIRKFSFEDLYELKGNREYCRKIGSEVNLLFNFPSYWNKAKKKNDEIRGLYIFYKGHKACYVGISNKIIARIKQHMCGKTHYDASMAYLIAREEYENKTAREYKGKRADLPTFKTSRENIQKEMKTWKIQIVLESDPYVQHFLEVFLSVNLQTHWNSFRTH